MNITPAPFYVDGTPTEGSAPTVQADGSVAWDLSGLPGGGLTLGPVVIADYSAPAGEMVRVVSAIPLTITLPSAPDDGTTVGVKDVSGGGSVITVACGAVGSFCVSDAADSGNGAEVYLTIVGQAIIVRYSAAQSFWYIVSNDIPLSQLAAPGYQLTAANPTGTTDTTGVMMGLAGSFVPYRTGSVLVTLCGSIYNASAIADGGTVTLYYSDIGSAPANGDALIGTPFGNPVTYVAATTAEKAPFSITALITGAPVNAPVWIDAALAAITGGTATIENLTLTAIEV